MAMSEAYVIDAVRTPVGKRNGSLAGVHPIDLGVHAFQGIFDRNDVDPGRRRCDRRFPGTRARPGRWGEHPPASRCACRPGYAPRR